MKHYLTAFAFSLLLIGAAYMYYANKTSNVAAASITPQFVAEVGVENLKSTVENSTDAITNIMRTVTPVEPGATVLEVGNTFELSKNFASAVIVTEVAGEVITIKDIDGDIYTCPLNVLLPLNLELMQAYCKFVGTEAQ